MKLTFVTELFYPSIGGQQIRYHELAEHLSSRGVEVTVLAIDHQGDLPATESIAGATVHRLVRNAKYQDYGRLGGRLSRDPLTIARFTKRCRSYLQKNPQDCVVFNQFPVMPAFYGREASAVSVADMCEFRSGRVWNSLEGRVMRGCHRVTTVSRSLEEQARNRYPELTVKTIPSGINVANYEDTGRKHFLFMGRLEAHKHPEMAVEATLAYNQAHGTAIPLKVVGGGDLKEKLVAQYGDRPGIEFCGFVSDAEKRQLLSDAEILLLPSVREGFPRAIAECMASGVPTITTDAPDNGGKDVVQHYDVGLSVPLNTDAFVSAISHVRGNYDHYHRQCLERCPELDWDRIIGDFLAFLGKTTPAYAN